MLYRRKKLHRVCESSRASQKEMRGVLDAGMFQVLWDFVAFWVQPQGEQGLIAKDSKGRSKEQLDLYEIFHW